MSAQNPLLPFSIVDSHHHCWDPFHNRSVSPMVQIARAFPEAMRTKVSHALLKMVSSSFSNFFGGVDGYLLKPYLVEDLRQDYRDAGLKLDRSVYIEAGWSGNRAGETRFAEELRKESHDQVAAGIVSPLSVLAQADRVERELSEHLKASSHFRGARFSVTHHPSPQVASFSREGVMASSRFRQSLGLLPKSTPGATFDLWCYDHQLAEAFDVVQALPELTFVLDHMGTPVGIGGPGGAEILKRWQEAMVSLANLKNVVVKISGVMPVLGFGFERTGGASKDLLVEKIGPLVSHCISTFGVDRCLVGSNFPVDKVSCSMADLYGAYAEVTRTLPLDDQIKIFSGNAKRVYRL